MRKQTLFIALLAIAACLAVPSPESYVVYERRSLSSWRPTKRAAGTFALPMRFALRQSNLHELDARLNDVAHPESSNYGKHYTAEQVKEAFSPSDNTVNAIMEWLHTSGHDSATVSPSGNWVDVVLSVSQAEELLRTTYYQYEHSDGTKKIGQLSLFEQDKGY